MAVTPTLEQEFKFVEAFISADRLGEEEIDVTQRIYELVIYESMETPYLEGEVAISDDAALMEKIKIQGTELLTVSLTGVERGLDPKITKTFVMYNMKRAVRGTDNTGVYLFDLIEPHAYYNELKTYSRAYTGKIENVITQIINSELGQKVDQSYLIKEGSAQNIIKYLVPYLTPLEACDILRDRATTRNGSPFFLYASLYDNALRLGDLDKILQQNAYNKKLPMIYSGAAVANTEDQDQMRKASIIKNVTRRNQNDTRSDFEQGSISSFYTNTDLSTGISYRTHTRIQDVLNSMETGKVIQSKDQSIYDEDQKHEGKRVDTFNPVYHHQISSSNSFGNIRSIHDEPNADSFSLKVHNYMLRDALYKNMINVSISGVTMMAASAGVGDIIRLNFLKGSNTTEGEKDPLDKRQSGDYIIYRAKHMFRQTTHNVSVGATRIVYTEDLN